ncbi:XRE family transcriptional regulator [Hoylesella nanceiensis]|uniref:XRE family transcriptional regulator n=1 Tax=Hoylesella nanceiensis TaxID=425941 RepID=UPI001CB438A6|nr:XRE family transcriptional regulator [Hoylesella nanceiensis]MBF1421245.1 helix-turn-helix transcriptional regulator [Hoylesella nanceiensis]
MAKIGKELRKYFESQGIKQTEVAQRLGVKPPYITKIFSDEREIGKNQIEKWITQFGFNKVWLLTGEGEMLINNETLPEQTHDTYRIPLLPISAQGGAFNDFVVSVQESECERVISPIKNADFAISIQGDSMAPEYPSGSQVLIKRINERAFIEWGKTYVLDTCNGSVVKNLYPSDDPNKVICKSINPDFPPFEVSLSDVYGVYKVLMCMALK